jgi:hypothetical protein
LKLTFAVLVLAAGLAGNAHARNPGESAQNCVHAESGRDGDIKLTNTCREQIFVMWCGDQKYTKKRCGDGPRGGFYTHSDNIDPGGETTAHVRDGGSFKYGACKGSISFGNDGEYKDGPNGQYRCLPR